MRSDWTLRLLPVLCTAFLAVLPPQPAAFAAGLPPELATTAPPKSASGDGMADTRQGGESWADAVVITALPFTDTGATCDNADDITPPCAYSQAPDVVYQYTPPVDQQITLSLCGSGYDTVLGIYDVNHVNLDCNDDFCGLQSEIDDFQVHAGQTYYIVVDGFSTSCGSYQITLTNASQPCVVECPPGAEIEGEPPCVDGYHDLYNGGCGGIAWTFIQPQNGDCATMCGRSCTYLYNGISYRDTDWYDVTAAGGPVSMTGTAEFPLQLLLIYGTACNNLQYVYADGPPCQPVTLSWTFEAGQDCWLWAAPAVFSGVPESNYVLDVCGIAPTVTGACCWEGACYLVEEGHCGTGAWLGPGTDCDPDPCVADPSAACCLADGTCAMMTVGECSQAQGVWQGAGYDCDPDPCAATPVEATSWGRIKNAFRK
jgi:hypothetical protein